MVPSGSFVHFTVLRGARALASIEIVDQVHPTLRQGFMGDLVVVCAQSAFYQVKQRCRCLPHDGLQRLQVGSKGEPRRLSAVPYKGRLTAGEAVGQGACAERGEFRRAWTLPSLRVGRVT